MSWSIMKMKSGERPEETRFDGGAASVETRKIALEPFLRVRSESELEEDP